MKIMYSMHNYMIKYVDQNFSHNKYELIMLQFSLNKQKNYIVFNTCYKCGRKGRTQDNILFLIDAHANRYFHMFIANSIDIKYYII